MSDVKVEFPGFITIITALFVWAKLTKLIDWSWWWVFSPLWIAAAIALAVFIVIIIVAGIMAWRS